MYAELIDFSKDPAFIEFVETTIDRLNDASPSRPSTSVRGVHIEVDAFWVECYLADWFRPHPPGSLQILLGGMPLQTNLRLFRSIRSDLEFEFSIRPGRWKRHCNLQGILDGPIIIKFILLAPVDVRELMATDPGSFPRTWREHRVVYEERPPCRGMSILRGLTGQQQLGMGASVGRLSPDTPGSAGGFLINRDTDTKYLVGCAHVMGSTGEEVYFPAPRFSGKALKIGKVAFSQMPAQQVAKCNRVMSPKAEIVDLAVVELDDRITFDPDVPAVGPVATISLIRDMNPGDTVFFCGKSSGTTQAKLAQLSVMDTVNIDNNPHCFRDLFVITSPTYRYVNTHLARGGDSGAWILNTTNNLVAWDGMLIAGDGTQVLGCFAENIITACGGHFGQGTLELI